MPHLSPATVRSATLALGLAALPAWATAWRTQDPDERASAEALAATLAPHDEWKEGCFTLPYVMAWQALPAFEAALAPGEVELAPRSLYFGQRDPGRLVAGIATDWPEEVEALLLTRVQRDLGRSHVPTAAEAAAEPLAEWPASFRAWRSGLLDGRELYVLAYSIPTVATTLSFVLRDPATGACSPSPVTLGLWWTAVPESGPEVWTVDLDGDGALEIGFRVTDHNGTITQRTGIRWFHVSPELALTEGRTSLLVDEVRVVSHDEQGVVRARLVRTADGGVREDHWFENPKFGLAPRALPEDLAASYRAWVCGSERVWEPAPRVR